MTGADSQPLARQQSLPVLNVRGSYYDVGFNVGRTFCGLIEQTLENHPSLNSDYLPLYETSEGKALYDRTLQAVTRNYPEYLRELQGLADGARVPFYKLFLLHIDDILPNSLSRGRTENGCQGCSTVCLNEPNHEILGHTEDALKEQLNNVYILRATITECVPEEKFTAFCYAGLLPGYAMGFNSHGLVYSINIIQARHLAPGRLPRTFVARKLLTADTLESALTILRCKGTSIGDAMSVNLTFLNQSGDRLFHNIEVAPSVPATSESALSVLTISPGEVIFHANKFLRLNVPDLTEGLCYLSSEARHQVRENHLLKDTQCVIRLLGDETHPEHRLFRTTGHVFTIAVGIFDCNARTWTLYMDNPKTTEPILVMSLDY